MGAGDPVAYASEEEIGFPKPDRSDAAKIQLCNRLEADEKMISYLDRTCRIEIEPIRKNRTTRRMSRFAALTKFRTP